MWHDSGLFIFKYADNYDFDEKRSPFFLQLAQTVEADLTPVFICAHVHIYTLTPISAV